jgi:hypothetical protein
MVEVKCADLKNRIEDGSGGEGKEAEDLSRSQGGMRNDPRAYMSIQ